MHRRTRLLLIAMLVLALCGALLLWRAMRAPVEPETATNSEEPKDASGSTTTAAAQRNVAVVTVPAMARRGGDAGTPAPQASRVIASKWGGGPDELGRERPREGNPEAPMSLAVLADGSILVVDQVNGRLVRIRQDGTRETIPSPVQAPQDVAVARDGSLLVMDRLADKQIAVLGPDGKLVGTLPVEGENVPEGGGVTGVFSDKDGVYVEREHGALVRIGNLDGKPDGTRDEIPGRPSRDGRSYLSAALVDRAQGSVLLNVMDREGGLLRFAREIRLGEAIAAIVLLDSDASGLVYLGVLSGGEDEATPAQVTLVALDGNDGHVVGRRDVPANAGADETFRDFAVKDEGGVVYAHRDESGVRLETYDLR